MTQSVAITTLFIDLGNVVLTDSWGPAMRQKALDRFGFDLAEVADRSRLTFEGYEEGKITLEEYLDLVVFYQQRSFSRKALTDFMLECSFRAGKGTWAFIRQSQSVRLHNTQPHKNCLDPAKIVVISA